MKTVKEILMDYLKAIGADGLAGDECGCGLDDFAPCGCCPFDCVPARKEIAPADHEFAGYVPMEAPADSVQGLVGRCSAGLWHCPCGYSYHNGVDRCVKCGS